MKKLMHISAAFLLVSGFLFACRGGTHHNNDHDYDGKNENNDGNTTQQIDPDSTWTDTNSRYPVEQNPGEEKK